MLAILPSSQIALLIWEETPLNATWANRDLPNLHQIIDGAALAPGNCLRIGLRGEVALRLPTFSIKSNSVERVRANGLEF